MINQGTRAYASQKQDHPGESLRILVGMSGGIHSAVTAALLKTQGHEVIGVHLDLKVPAALAGAANHCSMGNARADAEKAAAALGIELHVVDVSELYRANVVEAIIHEAVLGKTPNPCVACNCEVKLLPLFEKAKELRCQKVATGHGAQLLHDSRTGSYQLLRGGEPSRDQSHFLFSLTQEDLSKLLLPLGNFPKAMVSRLGAEYGFTPALSNSQSICFPNVGPFVPFIESRLPASLRPKGVIKTVKDQILGEHEGLHRYRFGEPVKLELSSEETELLVVVGMDHTNHSLILGPPEYLLKKECVIFGTHWLKSIHQLKGLRCLGRIAPDGASHPCHLTFFENQTAHLEFDEPQGPLFPGQAIVFYLDNEVLGGGWIRTMS